MIIDYIFNIVNTQDLPESITQDAEDVLDETLINEVKSKSRLGNWSDRNYKRHGRAKLPKHTPSKKGHKKYFTTDKPIKIY